MKNDINCLESLDLGKQTIGNLQPAKNNFAAWKILIHDIYQKLIQFLLADSNELQVVQKVNRQGQTYWYAYDPKTGKSFTSGTETDVIMWIERLHRY